MTQLNTFGILMHSFCCDFSNMDQVCKRLYQGLEILLKCPLCKKNLAGPVYMCGSGHTVCSICTKKSSICSQCQAPFTKIPNLLAQSLLSQADYVKQCLTYLNDSSGNLQPISRNTVEERKITESKDEVIPGQYRCWITDECGFNGTFAPIVKHFKDSHPFEFEEHLKENLPYSNSWIINYVIGKNFNRALNIGGLLFIVHLSINDDEEVSAYVLMYTGHSSAFRHLCRIEIECDDEKLSYKKGKVLSAQSSEDIIRQLKLNVLHITRNKPLYNALRKKIRFKCSITIEKRNDTNNDMKKRTVSSSNNGQSTNSPHKHSIIVNNSVAHSEINHKNCSNKPEKPKNREFTSSVNSWRKIKGESYSHNQLYPNLGAHGFSSDQRMNDCYRSLPLRENPHNSANIAPSAPVLYERPPPINPFYQQHASTSIHNHDPEPAEKTKPDDKCVVC